MTENGKNAIYRGAVKDNLIKDGRIYRILGYVTWGTMLVTAFVIGGPVAIKLLAAAFFTDIFIAGVKGFFNVYSKSKRLNAIMKNDSGLTEQNKNELKKAIQGEIKNEVLSAVFNVGVGTMFLAGFILSSAIPIIALHPIGLALLSAACVLLLIQAVYSKRTSIADFSKKSASKIASSCSTLKLKLIPPRIKKSAAMSPVVTESATDKAESDMVEKDLKNNCQNITADTNKTISCN